MTQVDGEVDLVDFCNFELASLVVHKDSYKLVAYLGCMLRIVRQTELLSLAVIFQLWVLTQLDTFRLDPLRPADLIEAFPEEYNVYQHYLVVNFINLLGYPVQEECENFVHQDLRSILV